MSKMNPVVHFEMPADDLERMKKFYGDAFGWTSNQLGSDYGNYAVMMTSETGPDNFPTKKGRINGGFFPRTQTDQTQRAVIAVDDIRESMKAVEAAGGKILGGSYKAGEPDDIPGVGLYCNFIDTEGNHVAMLQPKPMAPQA